MKSPFNLTVIITITILLLALTWLFRFGISDFVMGMPPINNIWETKPWRPWCRAIFSIIMGAVLILATIGILKYQANR